MSEEPGLGLWFRLIRAHFRFLLGVSFLAGVLTLAIVLLVPRWYTAQATILPPHEDTPNFRSLDVLTASLQLDRFLPFTEQVTLGDVYLAIMDSDRVARQLIERFDLKEHYGQGTMVKTIKELRSHSEIVPSRKRILTVTVEDKDPEMAADLANAYVEELDAIFLEIRSTAGGRQRVFLEKRVARAKADLDSLDVVLIEAQIGKGVTALSGDMSEAAMAAGELIGRRLVLTVQREVMNETGITSGPAHRQMELELEAIERQLAGLPGLGLDVAQKIRDQKMQEFLYQELVRQLEAASIEEARNTPAVEVLDIAYPPDRHSRPRRGLASIAGAFMGFAIAFTWVVYARSRA